MIKILSREISNIHAAALILGAAGFFSKILGVYRDRLLASHFGAGRELDMYYAAFQIPDFMSVVFLLGAGSAAILPVLQERMKRDKESAQLLIVRLACIFFVVASVVIAVAMLNIGTLMRIVTPGFSDADLSRAAVISRIILLSPLLLGLSSIFSSVVQTFHRFFAYALAPIAYNAGIIMGILFLVPLFGLTGLGMGVVFGALLHFMIQFAVAGSLGFFPRITHISHAFSAGWTRDRGILKVIFLSFPRVIALSFSQIIVFALVSLGSTLAQGSIAVFNLAYNLYFVPIGIFGISYSVTLFPRLSQSYLDKKGGHFFDELFLGMRTILFWVLPSSALFIVLRAHIVRVALGAGLFTWEDTRLTAASLAFFAIAMGVGALSTLFIRAFYAIEQTRMPLIIDALTLAVSLGSAYSITTLLKQHSAYGRILLEILRVGDLPHPEVVGLAAGFAIGIFVNVFLLYVVLMRTAGHCFRLRRSFPFREVAKVVIAAVFSGGIAYAARVQFADVIELRGLASVFFHGFIAGLSGLIAYILLLLLMRSEDLASLRASVQGKLLRLRVLPKSWDGESTGKG